jgi:Tfp pilus assembly protein PilF
MRCPNNFWFCVLFPLLISCASPPTPKLQQSLLRDELFTEAFVSIDPDSVFRVSPEMKAYLRNDIADQIKRLGHAQGLFTALYSNRHLKLEYDSSRTRTANEAFADRTGNCLSLAIMTAAFADELELSSNFDLVAIEENWLRLNDLYITSTHVNLTLGQRRTSLRGGVDKGTFLTIDFSPLARDANQKSSAIDRRRILAMYMNNRAAETLVHRQPLQAYWWAREAINQDPTYASAFNTLSIVYRRAGYVALSELPLRHALTIDPNNLQALSNLRDALSNDSRLAERDEINRKIRNLIQHEPYHFFDLGRTAFEQGKYLLAKEMFSREISRQPYNHEFHFWLARSFAELGDGSNALRHLSIAFDTSTTTRDQGIYSGKLVRLKKTSTSQD